MSFLLQFGSFVFPAGFSPASQDSPRDVGEQELPRAAGSVVQDARHQSRRLSVEGSAMGFGGGAGAIQTALDALRGGCEAAGPVQKLYFGRPDRYVKAQVVGISESYGDAGRMFGSAHKLLISFLAGDPLFYDNGGSLSAVGLTSAGGTVTPAGNAPAFATWSIPVTTGGTGSISLVNTTSGQSCTLGTAATAWARGDAIVLTRAKGIYTVTKNGVAAPGLLLNLIPTLGVGANVVTLSATGGIALGPLGCTYAPRWQS